jgi:cellulose synthase/poly-beta-1,6-N-acetylglucosamine synthase-like glycosyltransferase
MVFSTDPVHIVLLALLIIMAVIQGWYWLGYYRRAAYAVQKVPVKNSTLPPLSVIICARNEAENLRRFLPAVLEQDYPSYEVIVVNDCSEDSTYDLLVEMMSRYPRASPMQRNWRCS